MEIDYRFLLTALAVLIVATGVGLAVGDYLGSDSSSELYDSRTNITLNSDNSMETVKFDNKSINLTYENWEEFRVFLETENREFELNTTSDGERRSLREIVVAGNSAYRLHFRYVDQPERNEDDFIQLYRIEQIQ